MESLFLHSSWIMKDVVDKYIWKCKFPLCPSVGWSVEHSVGSSVCHSFLKGRKVTLPCSYRSTCSTCDSLLFTLGICRQLTLSLRITAEYKRNTHPEINYWIQEKAWAIKQVKARRCDPDIRMWTNVRDYAIEILQQLRTELQGPSDDMRIWGSEGGAGL